MSAVSGFFFVTQIKEAMEVPPTEKHHPTWGKSDGSTTLDINKILVSHNQPFFYQSYPTLLGGGNSNIFGIFTLKIGEDEPILTNTVFFQMGGSTTN